MDSQTLSLSIESGPKNGLTLECNPGDQIHIGRVVRGNALSIRDPSISQQHLAIRFLPEFNNWAVTDLGSSNGTYVNGALISPDDHSPLVDGDIIRIGEKTIIVVHLRRHGRLRRPEKVNEPQKIGGRGRAIRASARVRSTRVSEMKVVEADGDIVISDSDSAEGAEKEELLRQNSVGVEEEEPSLGGEKEARDEEVEDNMDSMTTGEWFDRMEEYLPKMINRVGERIVAELSEKARLFDEYVARTLNGREDDIQQEAPVAHEQESDSSIIAQSCISEEASPPTKCSQYKA